MQRCGLTMNGREIGTLKWEKLKDAFSVICQCPLEQGVIYKVTIIKGTQQLPLGVMMPENGMFTIKKVIPAYKAKGAFPPDGGIIYRFLPGENAISGMSFSKSQLSHVGEGYFISDLLLRNVAKQAKCLYTNEHEGYLLMMPLRYGAESPLAPFFCLGQIVDNEGECFLTFKLDKNGILILPKA